MFQEGRLLFQWFIFNAVIKLPSFYCLRSDLLLVFATLSVLAHPLGAISLKPIHAIEVSADQVRVRFVVDIAAVYRRFKIASDGVERRTASPARFDA